MKYERVIQKTINWIESHLHEKVSANDIADVAGFSQYHFHRIFQTFVGMTVSEYIRMRRLANSASILLNTDERIIDVALYFQFESQEAFTRAFKKMYHLPPGQYRKLMSNIATKKEETNMQEKTKGWFLSGSHPFNYEMGTSREEVHQGKLSGYLRSMTVQDNEGFATMMQQFKADRYRNKRIKLSGFIKTEDVQQFSGLWMRIDSAAEDILQFDNMNNRPIIGTNKWNQYSIVLDVPENSATISIGVLLTGSGHVWIDGIKFEEVGKDTPTTHMDLGAELSDEPTNLSFED